MLKKIMLGIVVAVLLIEVESFAAQERRGRPEAEQKQEAQAEQLRRRRAGDEAVRKPMGGMQQRQRQRTDREAPRGPKEAAPGKPQPLRTWQNQPTPQMFSRWLNELTKAYQENDREKMGQLLRKIHQLRQKWQEAGGRGFQSRGIGGWGRGFQGRGSRWGRGWQGGGLGRWPRGFQGRGMMMQRRGMIGGWGRGFQGRGIGRPGPSMPPPPFMEKPGPPMPPEDIDKPSPDVPPPMGRGGRDMGFQGRGMGGWGRGFQGRGIGRPGPGMPPPPVMEGPSVPPMLPEDIDKPGPDMPPRGMGGWGRGLQRRGMGRWGRGFAGPWCPWLRFPRPEVD